MSGSMLIKEVPVYSKEFDVSGVIKDYGVVTKLFFTYKDREIVMGIDRPLLEEEKFEDIGRVLIESYIRNLSSGSRKLQLHYWYIEEHEAHGEMVRMGHGIVTGHDRLPDAIDIHTSAVHSIGLEEVSGELILTTENSAYYCPLEYCRFKKQDEYPDIIPDYECLRKKYEGTVEYPSIEPGKVLLVLANFCDYYCH